MESIKLSDYIYLIKCANCKSFRFFEIRNKPPTKVTCLNCNKRLTFLTKKGYLNSMVVIKRIEKYKYYQIHNKGLLMKKMIGDQ